MRGLHKSKRVSWASDVNLCQVKLFLKEEAPTQVSFLGGQDHLQPKKSRSSSHSVVGHGSSDDNHLPPGFDAPQQPPNQLQQINLSEIPLIQWRPPPRVLLDSTWRVIAGEESLEPKDQMQREMRVLEAIYPRQSSIPPDPLNSTTDQEEYLTRSDLQIPIIPITSEDEDSSVADAAYLNSVSSAAASNNFSNLQTPLIMPSGAFPSNPITNEKQPDVAAAAAAFTTAIMKSNEPPGNCIDQDLLIQILSNPTMIEKLVTDYGTNNNNPMPGTSSNIIHPLPPTLCSRPNGVFPGAQFPPPPSFAPPSSSSSVRAPPPPPRDIDNYYKHLIHQHGGERQQHQHENLPLHNYSSNGVRTGGANPNPQKMMRGDSKGGKIMKPCLYFNCPRGCRNGPYCAFVHDNSLPPRGSSNRSMAAAEAQSSSKRMKLDREITGT